MQTITGSQQATPSRCSVASAKYTTSWVCTQCGTCSAICPTGAISVEWSADGSAYPRVDKKVCINCGLCLCICPGPIMWSVEAALQDTSAKMQCFLTYATDPSLRQRGASGGAITALLVHLFRERQIDSALVTRLGPDLRPEPFIAKSETDLCAAQSSKYVVSPTITALRGLLQRDSNSRLAVVGLPCQIHGISRASKVQKTVNSCVVAKLALFCGGTKTALYTDEVLARMGVRRSQVRHFDYRGGRWPGAITAVLDDGQTITATPRELGLGDIFTRAYFTPPRCLLCDDPFGAHADISAGDPWNIPEAATPEGHTLLVIHTPKGESILRGASETGVLWVNKELPADQLTESQGGIIMRARKAPARAFVASALCKTWRKRFPPPPLREMVRAVLALMASRVGSTRLGYRVLNCLFPPAR
ncbi:MAG: Coenzyme F420 hydrogenase/dehydrogenase, beta subunit C-terminal domain [Candidatus Zipacnadales bacterium]